jgi:hypothetical protein
MILIFNKLSEITKVEQDKFQFSVDSDNRLFDKLSMKDNLKFLFLKHVFNNLKYYIKFFNNL